jgi:hypothetical protein
MVASAISLFMGVVKPVLDKIIPDAKDRLEAEQLLLKSLLAADMGQLEINKQEAAHGSLFVAGWRPWIGWVCGASLAYAVIGFSFLNWILQVISQFTGHGLPMLPAPDTTITLEILMAMLGLGGLRTFEKVKHVATK